MSNQDLTTNNVAAAAKVYAANQVAVIRVRFASKAAVDDALVSSSGVQAEDADTVFRGKWNIGVILGARSQGLVDLDCDCPEAVALAPHFMPPTDARFGRATSCNAHYLYRSNLVETETGACLACQDGDGSMLIELRHGEASAYTVAPPSIHEDTHELIDWEPGCGVEQIPFVEGEDLLRPFRQLAIATVIAVNWPAEGGRHDFGLTLGGWLARAGYNDEEIRDLVEVAARVAGDEDPKNRAIAARDAARAHAAGKRSRGAPAAAAVLGDKVVMRVEEWFPPRAGGPFPDINKNGYPRATLPNTKVAFDLIGVRCSYDLFKLRYEVNGHAIEEFAGEISDPAIHELRAIVYDSHGFDPPKPTVLDAVQTLANQHRHHPVRDYLDVLRWDGVPRIDTWLIKYGGANDTEFTRAVGAIVLMAAVRRVRHPGCKFDEMLVLEGEQGTNKSQAVQALSPNPDWFSDQLPLGLQGREAIEATAGRWIIEASELQGIRKADIERIKAWMSGTADRGRMAYGMVVTDMPRQFIVIGTTNADRYLRDTTGNRRFWPVRIERFDLDALGADRDQLWAEAAAREASGASIRLPEHLWAVAAAEQEEREAENPLLSVLDRILREDDQLVGADWVEGKPLEGKILADDIWTILGIRPGHRSQTHFEQVGVAMIKLGWTRMRLRSSSAKGGRAYFYVRGPEPYRLLEGSPPGEDGVAGPARYVAMDRPAF